MKGAPSGPKLSFLRSIVADARISLPQTSETERSSTFGPHGLDQPTHRHDPLHPTMDTNAAHTGEEPGAAAGAPSGLDHGTVPEPVPEAALRPLKPASTSTSPVDAGMAPALAHGEMRGGRDSKPKTEVAGRSLKRASLRTSTAVVYGPVEIASANLAGSPNAASNADVVREPAASAPDESSATISQVGRSESRTGHAHGNQLAGQVGTASDIVQIVTRASTTTTSSSQFDRSAGDRKQQAFSPQLQLAGAPATTHASMVSPEIAKRPQAVSRPNIQGAEPAEGSMLPNGQRLEDGQSEPASYIERIGVQPEVRPDSREMAVPTARALHPFDVGRNHRAETVRSPDVQIGHVDITVVSTDPAPQKPPRPIASPAPASSLASLHYLRRF